MRKLAILIIVVLVMAYLVMAHQRQHRYTVPAYTVEKIDILNGATPTQWKSEAYASTRHKRINELGKMRYQPSESLTVNGRTLQPSDTLTTDDFKALTLIDSEALTEKRWLTVRDGSPLRNFADRKLRLRTRVSLGDTGTTLSAGTEIKKAELDQLLAAGVNEISVVGSGAVVTVNATAILVILVFVAMALILQGMFWEPMMKLMHGRRKELEDGAEYLKNNVTEAETLEHDRTDRLRTIHRACLKEVADARHQAMEESEVIIKEMRHKMHTMRQDAEEELEKTMAAAEKQVQDDLPQLAEAIVATVTSKK
ncbi:MAG: ATP synthase F0 subunit B [Planctomycetota bacterium]